MWKCDEDRLALLELLERGRLPRRKGQADAWFFLETLSWTRTSGRRDELLLAQERSGPIRELLDRVWAGWREHAEALRAAELDPTPRGWLELQDRRRASELGELPARLNRRTALAAVGPDSKATLSARRLIVLGDTKITRDAAVRMRPPRGMRIVRGSTEYDAHMLGELLGEVAISERALNDGTRIEGCVDAVLTVENLGPFEDMELPDGWLGVHVPGWNTASLDLVLEHLHGTPLLHFGDLDPAGVRIMRHLRGRWPRLQWFVPQFWREYVGARGMRMAWPAELDLSDAPTLVQELKQQGLWLEQELLALDPRLGRELQRWLKSVGTSGSTRR